jgi:peptidoglycan L-alanyl-D-glutamate endopeptidase CwlK
MDSRNLSDLHPLMRGYVLRFLEACHREGITLIITCTLRSMQTQAKLYAQGRSAPGKIVTNALPGQSLHNYGLAIDCVPIVGKELIWDDYSKPANRILWAKIGKLGESAGLRWSGRWEGKLKEIGHFEYPIDWREVVDKPGHAIDGLLAYLEDKRA